MGEAETVRAGLQDVEFRSAHGEGSVRIVQDKPYPTQVVGLFGEYEVNER